MQDHYTKSVSHIGECTYKLTVDGPPSQLTIAACKTITPNHFYHIGECTYILMADGPPFNQA